MSAARVLPTRMVAKVWGCDVLPAPFAAPPGERIGEIWFEPPPELPQVLVKYLFTSEKLSVQVHPSDATARSGEAGKEECWLVLDAEPDARLAIGFDREVTREEMEAAARDGTIESLLTWHPARPGVELDLGYGYNIDAVVHAAAKFEDKQNNPGVRYVFRLEDGAPVALTDQQIDDLWVALSGHEVSEIRDAIFALNDYLPQIRLEALVKGFGAATRSETK